MSTVFHVVAGVVLVFLVFAYLRMRAEVMFARTLLAGLRHRSDGAPRIMMVDWPDSFLKKLGRLMGFAVVGPSLDHDAIKPGSIQPEIWSRFLGGNSVARANVEQMGGICRITIVVTKDSEQPSQWNESLSAALGGHCQVLVTHENP